MMKVAITSTNGNESSDEQFSENVTNAPILQKAQKLKKKKKRYLFSKLMMKISLSKSNI